MEDKTKERIEVYIHDIQIGKVKSCEMRRPVKFDGKGNVRYTGVRVYTFVVEDD